MTLFTEAAERMARAVAQANNLGSLDEFSPVAKRHVIESSAKPALTALIAFLSERGLRVVPVEATPDMAIGGGIAWMETDGATAVDPAHACYSAMIAAAPNVWEGE